MELFNIHHVGARSGTIGFPKVRPLHGSISCTTYDADEKCCPQIENRLFLQGYKNVEVIAKGIGKSRRAKFNLNYDPNTSSLFEPNHYYKNYYIEYPNYDYLYGETFSKVKEVELDLIDLDLIDRKNNIDFISLDTQGSELDILKSGKKSLEKTIGIYTEINFMPIYKDIPLFGDICSYLDKLGFQIINIDTHDNLLAPRTLPIDYRFKKVLAQGDALFLKKPELLNTEDERRKMIFAAIIFGQVEYAAYCIKGLKIRCKYPKNTWQYTVNKFISIVNENNISMPKTFNQIISKEDSFARFSDDILPDQNKVFKKIKKIRLIVLFVRFLRNIKLLFTKLIKKIMSNFYTIFLPDNKLEELYKEIGKNDFSILLKKKRIKSIINNF